MSDTPNSELRALFSDGAAPPLESVVNETRSRMEAEGGRERLDLSKERADLARRLRTGRPTPENRPLLDLAGITGGGCLLLGLASLAFTTGVHPASLGLIGIGAVLLAVFAIMDRARVAALLSARSTVYGANLSITLSVLLGILVVTNLLATRYYTVIDLTGNQLNSLSPQSIELLNRLKDSGREITITAFYPKDADHRAANRILEDTFARYTIRNPHLKFAIVDPDVNRKLAEEKGITKAFTILFEAGNNETRIQTFDEPSITGALLKVTNPESKVVYFVVGHNELRITSDDNEGLSRLTEYLGRENLVVKELSLPKENGVPADAAAVVLARPSVTPLQNQELKALKDYVGRGGNLLVLVEPFQAPEVAAWLAEYGITPRQDMVLDLDSNYFNEPTTPILSANEEADHPLLPELVMTRSGEVGLTAGIVAPSARSLELSNGGGFTWTPLFGTASVASYGKTDPNASDPSFADGDIPGPLTVIAAAERSADAGGGRIVVAGEAQWLTNANIAKEFNRDFAVNALTWLVGSEHQIAIRPKEFNLERANLQGGALRLVSATIFGIPVLVAAMGIAVWWRRRTW